MRPTILFPIGMPTTNSSLPSQIWLAHSLQYLLQALRPSELSLPVDKGYKVPTPTNKTLKKKRYREEGNLNSIDKKPAPTHD
jgi:hypothetical protein